MSTRDLVDEELAAFIDIFPAFDLSNAVLPQLRETVTARFAATSIPEGLARQVTASEIRIPGPAGAPDLRALLYQPKSAPHPMPALLHLHGGGLVAGTPDIAKVRNHVRAFQLGATVLSVDYRLAPETKFQSQVEDCFAGLCWLRQEAERLCIDASRIGIIGESAGGCLAAATALFARGRAPLAFQCLIYPMLDDRIGAKHHPDRNPHVGEFAWTRGSNQYGWRAALGPGFDAPEPFCAPARVKDLSGAAPAFIAAAALDTLMEENVEYALRLLRARVPTELHLYPGAYHGFDSAAPDARVTRQFLDDCMRALARALKVDLRQRAA